MPDTVSDAPATIESNLIQQALNKIRALCKGNGVKTSSVTVQSADVVIHPFRASTQLILMPHIRERTAQGRLNAGNMLRGRGDLEPSIQNMLRGFVQDKSIRSQIADIVLRRKDKGFCLQNQIIAVPGFDNDFAWHEDCGTCQAQGYTPCVACRGAGRESCPNCHGRLVVPCTMCRGAGSIPGSNGQPQPCSRCHGQRQMACDLCHRNGTIVCRQCRGGGRAPCSACHASGGFTQYAHVSLQAQTDFDYERTALPLEAARVIDDEGSKLVESGDIQTDAAPAETQGGAIVIDYFARLPFGAVQFGIGKKPVRGWLFGYKGRIVDLPPFLDSLTARGVEDLEAAAAGAGFVAEKIRRAGRYRMIGQALLACVKLSPAKTAGLLLKKYADGLSKETAQKIAKLSDRAIARVTRGPRLLGLAGGLVLVGTLYAFYYLGSGRGMLAPFIANPMLNIAVDLFIILIGGMITTLCIQLAAQGAMKHALGNLLRGRKAPLPPTRSSGWWGYAGGLALYLAMIEATVHTGAATPEWYESLRAMTGLF